MRSSFKKSIAILLAAVLAFSVMTVGVVGASAADSGLEVTVSSTVPELFPTSTQHVDRDAETLTVTYWFNFQDYMMVNNQWLLTYNPSILQYNTDEGVNQTVSNNKTTYLVYKFPDNELGSMEFNPVCEQQGVMKGNITKAEGFDCYDEGKLPFLSITFDIIAPDAISTEVNLDLQVLQVRHKNADVSTTPVDFINHSEIVNNDVPFTADDSYTAAYEGEYNPEYTTGPVHLDKFRITGYNLSLGSNIAIQTYVSDAKVAGYDTFWVTATAQGKDETAMTADSHSSVYGSVFVYDQIFSSEMYKDVSFVLHATKDGVEYYGDPYTTSIQTYVLNDLNSATGAYKTLLVDLLNYGAAAQTYTGSNSVPVNSTLTPEQQACATQDYACTYNNKTVARIDNPTAAWYGAQCVLGSSIQPMLTFADTTGQGIDGVSVRAVINGKECTIDSFKALGNNQYSFTFDEVYANQLATPIEFTVMNNGQAISNTYRFDVESYAAQCFQNGTAADQAMIAAMVKYGRAAKAYAG